MRPPLLLTLSLCAVLLGLAWGLPALRAPAGPLGEEATVASAALSLRHDRDLVFDHRDLLRAYRMWDRGPAGLVLFTNDGGKTSYYGRPMTYPLVALPLVALCGARGLLVLNVLLVLAMLLAAARLFGNTPGAGWFVAAFFFASAVLGYVLRAEPVVLTMAGVFFGLWLWWRRRHREHEGRWGQLAAAGAALAVASTALPLAGLPGLAVLGDLASRRRFRGALLFAAGFVATGLLLAAGHRHLTGEWTAYGGDQRRVFVDEYPVESLRELWQGAGPSEEPPGPGWRQALALAPRNAWYLLTGRNVGLLPYFPMALLALSLVSWSRLERQRGALLGCVAAAALIVLLRLPHGLGGGEGALGSRLWASLYPVFLFLPPRLSSRFRFGLAVAAAGAWAVPAAFASAAVPAATVARLASFAVLPAELTLLKSLPGTVAHAWRDEVWVLPRHNFWVEEGHPHGVWMRGASRSQAFVVSTTPLATLGLRVHSLSEVNELTIESAGQIVRVRFDTAGKRDGTPLEVPLRPVARSVGFFPGDRAELVYRLTLTSTDGVVPARRDPKSRDHRLLGVFLEMTEDPPAP
jgi:hypothetical protein